MQPSAITTYSVSMKIEGIAYHHTGDSSGDPQFKKVDGYHKNEGFPKSTLGFYVGYHYFSGKEGTIKQARANTEDGAHTVNCGCSVDESGFPKGTANERLIGICFAGNFLEEEPDPRALAAVFWLTVDLQRKYGIGDKRLYNHSDLKRTSCPGIDMVAKMLEMKKVWKGMLAAEAAVDRAVGSRKVRLQLSIKRAREILFPNSFPPFV